MPLENTLEKFGLSEKEAKVYLACLQIGPASILDLAKKAEIKRPTVYLAIDSLLKKGLVSLTRKGNKTFYLPSRPQKLLKLLQEKEKELQQTLPQLEALYNLPPTKPKIQIFEGLEGLLSVYKELFSYMSKKEEILFFASIKDIAKHFQESLDYFSQNISGKRYYIRELINQEDIQTKYIKDIQKIKNPNHQIRVISPKCKFIETDNVIFGQRMGIFSVKEDIFVIVIASQAISQSHRALFEMAWKAAKPLEKVDKLAKK